MQRKVLEFQKLRGARDWSHNFRAVPLAVISVGRDPEVLRRRQISWRVSRTFRSGQ